MSALEDVKQGDEASRKHFLKMVGGAGAAGALAIFVAACGSDDEESSSSGGSTTKEKKSGGSAMGDGAIVNYALTLEYLEADFYEQVLASGEITDKKIGEAAKKIGQNEQEHVEALIATAKQLGVKPAAKPMTKFDDVLAGGPEKILETAAAVENLGAAAAIKDPKILAAALSIHSVEARHAAALNQLTGKTIVPDGAFAKPATMDEVLEQVKPFLA
jgi:hypothetical protein